MGNLHLNKGKAILVGLATGVFSVLLGALAPALPAHAASTIQIDWVNATTIHFSGSAIKTPVDVTGDFVGNVIGTPAGSQSFMAASSAPVEMSFGCNVSITFDIFPDASGKLDYSKGEILFTTSAPSTCSQDTLKANIAGLTHDPSSGTANISLMNAPVGSVDKRGPAGGADDPAHQTVNVTAGMGPASDYNGIPQTDIFLLCEAKGDYVNNIDALIADCLAKKSSALSANPITSSNLETLKDGKGPNGGDEKGWTGQFKNVKAGVYMVCSTNFQACQLFTKNPGSNASVYVIYGSTAGSTIPGTPPGQGDDQKVCTTGDGLAGALAWVLCPAVQLMASATQFFENNIIIPFMTVSPLTTNADNPIYILWQDIRNFANVGFILFFFIVIFSQATSIGLSNYGIKRILPKMVAVVIAVNLSYFGAAFIIDAFNIFGAGVSQLVTSALQQAGTQQLNSGTSAGSVRSIFTLGGAALVTIVATGGSAIGWFFSFLFLALLVIVVVVIVLVVRQMAIIVLVILSPIIILMYMLPNTEGTGKKGTKTFTQLMTMYPMMVLLFASGKIFGIILQQPDFKLVGDGVSDDVAQAVRVILQALIYVIPLVFLPATFAASGSLMSRGFSLLHSKAIQPRANRLKEDAGHMAKEAQMRATRIPGVGRVAGMGMRRNYVREQRRRNLSREQEEYVAGAVGGSSWMRRRAAGVSGQAGQTRAAAFAANTASKGRNEDIDNEMALLNDEMRDLGVDQKTFAAAAGRYLEDPTSAANQVLTGSNGRTFNFQQNEGRLQRALLNSAASQGEIRAVEAARMSGNVDQTMLDDIIRRNDGKLKEKGGYHLATRFDLGHGRTMQSNATGEGLATDGSVFRGLPGQTPAFITNPDQIRAEMVKQRVIAMANSGANSIAGMKAGMLTDTARVLTTNPTSIADPTERAQMIAAQAAIGTIDAGLRARLKARAGEIHANKNTLARAEADPSVFTGINTSTLL